MEVEASIEEIVAKEEKLLEKEEEKHKDRHKTAAAKRAKLIKQINLLESKRIESLNREGKHDKKICESNIDFVLSLNDSNATICDEIVKYNLEKSGCDCPDPRIRQLIGIAAKKFLFEVLQGARDHRQHRIKGMNVKKKKNEEKMPAVLELDYLLASLKEKGMIIKRTNFDIGIQMNNGK